MTTQQTISLAVTALIATIALGGCQIPPPGTKKTEATKQPVATLLGPTDTTKRRSASAGTSSAALELERKADAEARESERGDKSRFIAREIPVPLGVEPDVLLPRRIGRELSNLSLDEALSIVASDADEDQHVRQSMQPVNDDGHDGENIDPAARDDALRHYARGRDEALQRRHLAAVTYFLKALELTPNDTNVMREMASSYIGLGNHSKALQTYEQVLAVDPGESEALFMVALSAADRREFDVAAHLLGSRRRSGEQFPHDEGAPLLADYVLATSLAQLGYDRASIELSTDVIAEIERRTITSMYGSRIASVFRQRGELWRMVGDAYCRLGEYDNALAAYTTSASLPLADPDALAPRVLYANLRLGRVHMAQLELYAALSAQAPTADSRLISLCEYLRQQGGDTTELARAVLDLQSNNSSDPALVRAAAALLSRSNATALLRNYVAQQPDNIQVLGELLRWLASDDVRAATEFTSMIVAEQMNKNLLPPQADAATETVQQLFLAVKKPSDALRAARQLNPAPSTAIVEARLLMLMGGLGPAWTVLDRAQSQWPNDVTIHLTRVELAGHLEEPGLLRRITAAWTKPLSAAGYILQSRSLRRAGLADEALAATEAANDLSPDDAVVLTEIAWARLAVGLHQIAETDARLHAQDAVQFVEHALTINNKYEPAYRALTTVYSPGGPLADAVKLRETASRLFESNPDSRLYAQLVADESLARRRYEQALERALNLYNTDPSDSASLRLAVNAWRQMTRLEDASQWLKRQRDIRPGDPYLLEQWAAVQLWLGRPETAISELESQIAADPDDHAALRLLESTCIAAGRNDRAIELGEKRLLSRPNGVRRDLELAGLYISTSRPADAVERLTNIASDIDAATPEQLNAAAGMAGRIDSSTPDRDELVLRLTEAAIDRVANLSADIYRPALVVMARRDPQSGAFDTFAQKMVDDVSKRDGGGVQAALLWQQTAQELVDAGHPWAAGQLLRMRIVAKPALTDERAQSVLCIVAFVADAATGGKSNASIDFMRALRDRGALPNWPGVEAPATYDVLLYELSQVYHIIGDLEGSMNILRELISIAPNDAMALNNLGYILIERNEIDDRVIRMVEMAHKLEPNETNILDTIGWLRYKQGRFVDDPNDQADGADSALTYIERAVSEDESPSAEGLDHLGDALWRTGQTDDAARTWRRALDLLKNDTWRTDQLSTFEMIQSRIWWLVVVKPEAIYHREYGALEERLQRKLDAVDANTPPPVAPTFEELMGQVE